MSNDDYLLLGSKAPFQSNFYEWIIGGVDSLGVCGSVNVKEKDYSIIRLGQIQILDF